MGTQYNLNKNKQLGMPAWTAAGRLRKMIMFDQAIRLSENTCFRCHEVIETLEEFSIEHKIPWLNNDAKLFWNLDNIAFSHLLCNIKSNSGALGIKKGPSISRKIGPFGTSWCRVHKEFLTINQFTKDKEEWNELQNICKTCRSMIRSPARVS